MAKTKRKAKETAPAVSSKPAEAAPLAQAAPLHDDPAFPIVGIGASAGGLAAFEAFFSGMPAGTDPGMAFVLVQHLAPDHKSILSDLVKRYTRMRVFEVEDGMQVKPNCTYIIPPNRDMAFLNGSLQLLEPAAPRGQRLPIDFFFRSLAQDQHERAICIVLSGTGSDGTLGVRAVKGEGGMAMAQNPKSTEFEGMPRSAIATGLVDYVLPPAEMPAQLVAYMAHAFRKPARPASVPTPKAEDVLKKIFVLLRAQTGHDFSQYKRNTTVRRVQRRMAVHQIGDLDAYVRYLQQTSGEVDALFRDLLIGVTSLFRDAEAFEVLQEQAIPQLFAGKPAGAPVRIWVPGCSTGEEAYSIAILVHEHMDALKQSFRVQVFGTDIDRQAIDQCRAGLYPASIAADVSAERLARYFFLEPGGSAYRVQKSIRDMVIFSEQNTIKDPPFSKLDLISCRNLLIYLGPELQKKLIPLFHYALNPGGMLFLGTSESVGEFEEYFATVDRKSKLYQRKEGVHNPGFFLSQQEEDGPAPRRVWRTPTQGGQPLRELTERALLQQYEPAAALVSQNGDILYLHGRTGKYLEPAPGEADLNVLKMSREGLRRGLSVALNHATATKQPVHHTGLRVKTNGGFTTVNLTVRPVSAGPDPGMAPGMCLIVFEDSPEGDPIPKSVGDSVREGAGDDGNEAQIAALKLELRAKEEYLQTLNEELQTSNEEFKSANEEMQSVNEELKSTNEELETSKEELQSVNEELATVNSELQVKVVELSRSNNDMINLLAGTGIATVFVDNRLRILRFTPAATQVINLILTDVGRPVGHIVSNLVGYDCLAADVQAVLDSLAPKDIEVQTRDGSWYLLRIRPYRTLENVIEGAVITFTDVTEMKEAKAALRESEVFRRLAAVVRDAHDAITVQDLEGRIMAWNPGAERMYGWSEAEALAMNMSEIVPQGRRAEALAVLRKHSRGEAVEPYLTQRIAKGGRIVEVSVTATVLVNESGQAYAVATTEREVNMTVPTHA